MRAGADETDPRRKFRIEFLLLLLRPPDAGGHELAVELLLKEEIQLQCNRPQPWVGGIWMKEFPFQMFLFEFHFDNQRPLGIPKAVVRVGICNPHVRDTKTIPHYGFREH